MNTPTPWRVEKDEISGELRVATEELVIAWIATVLKRDEHKHNAALIVRAVNAHQAAVEIIKAVAEHFKDTDSPLGKKANEFLQTL